MTIVVRQANHNDAAAVARLYAAAWLETYRGVVSEHVLHAQAERVQAEGTPGLSDDAGPSTAAYVAEFRGEVIGFGTCGPVRGEALGTSGEIYAVYVTRRYQFRGIGSRLMGVMARHLLRHGLGSVGLWVARDNVAAVAFARALGAVITGARAELDPHFPVTELAITWSETRDLTLWDDESEAAVRDRAARGAFLAGYGQQLAHSCR
ncbi:GNAT family N-acetyltransferase [Chelatococcus sp. SYSU_G07232]|uniref:GNAT family N-acetyltransferase n=1 Tax=Chelatococcus albus TaxID=3047466 RepID=A0ABT7AE74_9HYPH|nr:GNAT family N-acetyltransferase [Chelatococcus sp. SYSU_G07232]MDJ1157670.1 GNAT family N-acetyltransferase [Chelatococcus sp. SYSU_G07232]